MNKQLEPLFQVPKMVGGSKDAERIGCRHPLPHKVVCVRLHLVHPASSWEQNMPLKRGSDCKTLYWRERICKSNSWLEADCTRLSGHPFLTQTWDEHITSSLYRLAARRLLQNNNTEKFVVCGILISWAEDYLLFSVLKMLFFCAIDSFTAPGQNNKQLCC